MPPVCTRTTKVDNGGTSPPSGVSRYAIGSGGSYATAAARALLENTELGAREIAEKAMKIAGEICIYTNDRVTIEELKG